MNWLDGILFHTDPSGAVVLAFILAVGILLLALYVRWLIRLSFGLMRAALQGRRERRAAEREVRAAQRRIRANHILARARQQRAGVQP